MLAAMRAIRPVSDGTTGHRLGAGCESRRNRRLSWRTLTAALLGRPRGSRTGGRSGALARSVHHRLGGDCRGGRNDGLGMRPHPDRGRAKGSDIVSLVRMALAAARTLTADGRQGSHDASEPPTAPVAAGQAGGLGRWGRDHRERR